MKSMEVSKIEQFLVNLENKLKEKNMSIPDFADKMGVSKMVVYNWIKRKQVMSLDKYFKACEILELIPDVI